ncbi:MAG: radical SAM protein [Candidatus Brocadiaceae bacterium]|nr:radical SAM protein [Candidatus Brocadiaceae bacterium]
MKALLINPSKYDTYGNLERYQWGGLPPLNLVIVASLMQEQGVKVVLVDEYVQDIPFDSDYDLVGISTTFTCTFPRVIDICGKFKEKMIPVVLGGTHATCMHKEVLEYCDAVILGEAEGKVEELLNDLRATDKLKPLYGSQQFIDLGSEPFRRPPYELVDMEKYIKLGVLKKSNFFAIESSRGCPMPCTFCSIGITHGKKPRSYSISTVVQEVRNLKKKHGAQFFTFTDDNFSINKEHCQALCEELERENIKFFCELPTTILRQPSLIESLAKAGCVSALLGMESINESNLNEISKGFNKPVEYQELFELFAKNRISAMAAMIFGFDNDEKSVFQNTVEFLKMCRVPRALFTILTPIPGTQLYDKLLRAGRIFNQNFSYYDGAHAVYQPKSMTPKELEQGFWDAYQSFYKLNFVISRTIRAGARSALYTFFSNMRFRKLVYQKLYPYNSGIGRVS